MGESRQVRKRWYRYQKVHDLNLYVAKLTESGFDAQLDENNGSIMTRHKASNNEEFAIRIELPAEFPAQLPRFLLQSSEKYGALAHVVGDVDESFICIGNSEHFAIDVKRPFNVLTETLENAFELVNKAMCDPEFNRTELFNEFGGAWACHSATTTRITCAIEQRDCLQELNISVPKSTGNGSTLNQSVIASANSSKVNKDHVLSAHHRSRDRTRIGKGVACHIAPENLILPPGSNEKTQDWWSKQLASLPKEQRKLLRDYARRYKSKNYYIVLSSYTGEQLFWFAIYCQAKAKLKSPLHENYLSGWSFEACAVTPVCTENLLFRAGATSELQSKHICIVGCGSLGGFVADSMASAGIGQMTLMDPDVLRWENLHRHQLTSHDIGKKKSRALKDRLTNTYPFMQIYANSNELSTLRDSDKLEKFDLVVVLTGNVNQELRFDRWLRDNSINMPVVYGWQEALGVGGHAFLSVPGAHGCHSCNFIDGDNSEQSLHCALDFIEPGQLLVDNYAGCGTNFLAYSATDAIQTAVVVSRLSQYALLHSLDIGKSLSWRGESKIANNRNVKLGHRFYRFKNNLEIIDCYHEDCPVCGA